MSGLHHDALTRCGYRSLDVQCSSDFQAALLGMVGHCNSTRLLGALRLYEQTRKMEVGAVALAPLFWRIANENRIEILEKCIDARVHATRSLVMSNPVLLDGMLRNLVCNAVKYTKPGGRILIGCRRVGDDVRIDVYDTGVGISPDHLPHVFNAFQRIDLTRPDGHGVGLFVVRRAANLLGHRVEVRSQVGHGSRFSIFARTAGWWQSATPTERITDPYLDLIGAP
jgi:signal transduction histidine kinase